ncbi:MAG: GGDEF domain-containing protein [Clostridia bacterium]|nr:GGDEF domain-containing protein [Clostridia bacterium]
MNERDRILASAEADVARETCARFCRRIDDRRYDRETTAPRSREWWLLALLAVAAGIVVSLFPAPGFRPVSLGVCLVFAAISIAAAVGRTRQRKQTAQELRERRDLLLEAYTDYLTGVFNRQAMTRYLEALLSDESVKSAGVLMMDIDDFKLYNDSLSHHEGDVTLRTVSDRLAQIAREAGLFVFRYGGEEFVMVMENPSEQDLIRLGVRIRRTIWDLSLPRRDDSRYERVTMTVGCAEENTSGGEELRFSELLLSADKQLYIGKKNGKNCVVYKSHLYQN